MAADFSDFLDTPTNYTALVLSGGGMKGFAPLGALHYYYSKGLLTLGKGGITEIAGTSIGAAIGLLLLCGYTPLQIFQYLYPITNFFPSAAPTPSTQSLRDFLGDVLRCYGMINISAPLSILEKMVVDALGHIPTLKQLWDATGIIFHATVTNVTKRRVEYLNYKNNPGLSVMDTVKMSCTIPGVFQKIEYNGCKYVDGVVYDNFPIAAISKSHRRVLGIITNELHRRPTAGYDEGFADYLYQISMMAISAATEIRVKAALARKGCDVVQIYLDPKVSSVGFAVDAKERMDMFTRGVMDARAENTKKEMIVEGWRWDDTDDGWGWDEEF